MAELGRIIPCLLRAPGTMYPAVISVFARCTHGLPIKLPPKIWVVLPSFLTKSSLLLRWLWITPQPLLLALAWAAGWRGKTVLSKAFKTVQDIILEYTSYH